MKRPKGNTRKRSFTSLFEPCGADPPAWRIRGSGVRSWPTDAANTGAIVSQLKRIGIDVTERSSGSPGNCDSFHLEAPFLDGGLHGTTGNYWFSPRGCFLTGTQAALLVARVLDLRITRAALERLRLSEAEADALSGDLERKFGLAAAREGRS